MYCFRAAANFVVVNCGMLKASVYAKCMFMQQILSGYWTQFLDIGLLSLAAILHKSLLYFCYSKFHYKLLVQSFA